MNRSGALRIAVIATTIAGLVFAAVIDGLSGLVLFGAYAGIGAYLAIRRPANSIGWLLMLVGWGIAIGSVPVTAPLDALLAGTLTPMQAAAAWANGWGWSLAIIGLLGVTIVFPSGRMPDGRSRWWSVIAIAAVVGLTVMLMIGPTVNVILTPSGATPDIPNPMTGAADAPWSRLIPAPTILYVSMVAIFAGGVVAFVVRYRRSVGIERLQYRWLVAGIALVAVGTLLWAVPTVVQRAEANGLALLPVIAGYPAVPIAIAIAVQRYRLYDIDRIISRTIAYAAVSTILVGVFGAGVVILSSALAAVAQGQTLAVAGSTLVTYAALQPVLRRVRRTVDRRFDRARYDADRTVLGFSDRLRNETDMEAVMADLARTTRSAVAPATMSLWFRDRGSSR